MQYKAYANPAKSVWNKCFSKTVKFSLITLQKSFDRSLCEWIGDMSRLKRSDRYTNFENVCFFVKTGLTENGRYDIIIKPWRAAQHRDAGVAQWQSSWFVISRLMVRLRSPAPYGGFPEWPKGADCKSVVFRLRWSESIIPHQTAAICFCRLPLLFFSVVLNFLIKV